MNQGLGKIESRGTLFSILLSIFFILIYLLIFDTKIDLNGDNAYYYMLGKALSTGEGYVNLNSINRTPNNHFPPGYPAIIATIFLFISNSIITIKIVNGIFLLLTVLMTYSLAKIVTGRAVIAAVSAIFILVNAHILRYSTIMMTEIPFMFFAIFTILLFIRTDFNKPVLKNSYFYYSLLTLVASYYIRSLGVALLAGFVLYLAIERKWSYLFSYIIGAFVLVLPWFLRGQQYGGNSYLKQLKMVNPYRPEMGELDIGGLFSRILSNIERYITKEIPSSIFSFIDPEYSQSPGFVSWLIGLIILSLIIAGLWKLKRYRWLILGTVLGNFGILAIWPEVWIGIRFILPLIPILVICLLFGFKNFLEWVTFRFRIGYAPSAWLFLLGVIPFVPGITKLQDKAGEPYSTSWENYFKLARTIRLMDDPNLVVACRKPVLFFLESETYTTNYKYTPDDQLLLKDLEDRQVDFVVVDQLGYSSTYRYLYPAVEKNQQRFGVVEVIKNPDTYLLKFNSE